MRKKILITGGTGFIGANLIKKLYGPKNEITVFAKDAFHQFLKGFDIRIIVGDITDYGALSEAVKGNDYVYHLAACTLSSPKEKTKIFGTNVLGTENVMKACLKSNVKKVV